RPFSAWQPSEHLRRKADDLHEVLRPQLAHDRPEDTGADRLALVVQDDGGVAVETDGRAVFATDFLGGAHDDGLADVALLHAAFRNRLLDRHHDDVAHGCVAAVRPAQNLDALHPARAGVVSDIQIGLHLDHFVTPDLWEPVPGYRQC